MTGFVPPRHGTKELVPRCQGYYGEQRDQKGEGGGDAPLGEDDAEVVGGPGEEHVHAAHVVHGHVAHVAVVGVVHFGIQEGLSVVM